MGYLIFRGVSTQTLPNVYVSKMPSHKKAAMRYTEFYVDGRDGAVHREEGFSNFDLEATLIMLHADMFTRQLINAWADGTGDLITSDDLTRCYRATVLQEVKYSRAVYNDKACDTARIIFNCQPYMYEATPSVLTYSEAGTHNFTNPGSATALPLIRITGSGRCEIDVARNIIVLEGVNASAPVYIDSEAGYVYSAAGARSMQGEFPELPMGGTYVNIGTGITEVQITPRWRWV